MPRCNHCKDTLGKKKKFEANKFNQHYCLESEDCIRAWREDRLKGLPKQKAVKEKADKKVLKDKLKKPSQWEAEAKTSFQKWIRLRDAERNCISCGSETSNPCWDGGHYRKAELYSGTIFDERNCHKQCRKCNYYENGNEASYRMGLVDRYGSDFVVRLESDANQFREYRYTTDDYRALKRKYDIKFKNGEINEPIRYELDIEKSLGKVKKNSSVLQEIKG